MRDLIPCPICGGFIEHDIRTGEVIGCDTCDNKRAKIKIDEGAARAFVETLVNDKVFGGTIQLIFDTLKYNLKANLSVEALLERMRANNPTLDKGEYEDTFRAALAIAFTAGSFYAMEAKAKETQQPKDIN